MTGIGRQFTLKPMARVSELNSDIKIDVKKGVITILISGKVGRQFA